MTNKSKPHVSDLTAVPEFSNSDRHGAEAELIAALDVDVRADGHGLPAGTGNYEAGAVLFSQLCVDCHGENLLGGRERGGALIGGRGTLTSEYPRRTIESYWPYSTILFDYIRRAMPSEKPGSLDPNDLYGRCGLCLIPRRNNWRGRCDELLNVTVGSNAKPGRICQRPRHFRGVQLALRSQKAGPSCGT